ncbi:hypothetical protein CRM22_009293 [Opisthorchis felineus]|uniref:receptor protein-tyrosine kinase n=1 Tax=Opisthorchis felineus TaxID=147828 RepID=A0A4S2L797_OPIFE|nr:hypothetical protein CRM22_009293 [Opisthorchis felineus]
MQLFWKQHVITNGDTRSTYFFSIISTVLVNLQLSILNTRGIVETQTLQVVPTNKHRTIKPVDLDHIAPEINTLLDTDVSEWRDWLTNTGKYEGWRLQTHPLLQRKVFGVCQVLRSGNMNWLFSPVIRLKEAESLIIEVTYTMRRCAEHPDPEALKFCQESLSLLVFHSDSLISENLFLNESQIYFRPIANLTLNDPSTNSSIELSRKSTPTSPQAISEERVARYVNRMKVQASKMAVAILDTGTCSTLRRVHLSFLACAMFQKNFVTFPRTITSDGTQSTNVQGQCIPGAAPLSGQTVPTLLCLPNGRWYAKSTGLTSPQVSFTQNFQAFWEWEDICTCIPGYGLAVDSESRELRCLACGENEYKARLGPIPCRPCPRNSFRRNPIHGELLGFLTSATNISDNATGHSGGQFACQCKDGYYRHPKLDNEDSPCTTLPSAPVSLEANISDPVRIKLHWQAPSDTGGRENLWFVIKCLDQYNQSCTNQPTYVQPQATRSNSITIIGLTLGGTYTLSVTASNDLTGMFPKLSLNMSTNNLSVTLPQPVNFTVSNIAIDSMESYYANSSIDVDASSKESFAAQRLSSFGPLVVITWSPPNQQGTKLLASEQTEPNHAITEYQAYVWISPLSNPHLSERKRLIHFLSDTRIPLTDLPRKTLLKVWIRPRTIYGWGKFTKVELQYPKQPSSRQQRIIWLTVICSLALCLLLGLLLLLKFHKSARHQWRQPSTTESPNEEKAEKTDSPCLNQERIIAELQMADECSSLLNKSTHEATEAIDHQATSPLTTSFERAMTNKDVFVEEVTAEDVSTEDKQTSSKEVAKTYKELDPERINIRFTIGEGEFGKVCAGAFDEYTLVAVKMLHPGVPEKTQQDFLKEADTMQQLSHPNIIKLIGVVTRKEPRMIVTEFMHHGSLDKYLQGVGKSVRCCGLLRMLIDVCKGMKYLSGLGYVHRDLAARNILIDEKQACKISDFGLARKIGEKLVDDAYTLTGGKVPIRWTAPEAVIYRRFTIASDVWSFGIVSWEVFSYGQRPYWDWTNQTVISMLERGYRLPCPEACPKEMHCLMLNCWSTETEKRPNFDKLGVYLEKILEDEEPLVSSLPNGEPHSGTTSFGQPTFVLPTAETFTNLQITSSQRTKMRTDLPTKALPDFQEGQNTDYRKCTTRAHYGGSTLKHSCNAKESLVSQNGIYYNVTRNEDGLEPAVKVCGHSKDTCTRNIQNSFQNIILNGDRV